MRITFIIGSFRRGGKERRCLQLIQGLNKIGYNDIQLILINDLVEYPELFDTSTRVEIVDRKGRGLSLMSTYRVVQEKVSNFRPDVVQAWGELSILITGIIRLTSKFVFICANVADCNMKKWYSSQWMINRFGYCLADAVVGNSCAGLRAYQAPKRKARCIYNGFNESRYDLARNVDKNEIKRELNVDTKYLVAMFARIDYFKDPDAFIALARNVLKKRDDVTFLAVGKGLYYESYRDIPSPDEKLRFIGFRSDVEQLMSITDVSILFSNYKFHKEGVSNSIMESMALGTPVIATNDGGSPEIITHGENGFLVDCNDVETASNILCTLLDNPEELQRVGLNAKEVVQQKFLLNGMVDNYLSLYKELIDR